MDIFRILSRRCCRVNIHSRKKTDVLREISALLGNSSIAGQITETELFEGLWEREQLGTTGFGGGFAIPHCKLSKVDRFAIALAASKKGADFESLDGKKVHLFVAIVGPEDQPRGHVQLLAQISRILKDEKVRAELVKSKTDLALYEDFLRHCEAGTRAETKSRKQKLMILVLKESRYFYDIIEYFTEMGIRGASVMESKGMRHLLSNVPLFADFIHFLGERGDETRTVFVMVYEDMVDEIVKGIEEIVGDLDHYTGAMVVVLEPYFVKGTMEL
jgi:PTS system nitrogen regulatory IIA component